MACSGGPTSPKRRGGGGAKIWGEVMDSPPFASGEGGGVGCILRRQMTSRDAVVHPTRETAWMDANGWRNLKVTQFGVEQMRSHWRFPPPLTPKYASMQPLSRLNGTLGNSPLLRKLSPDHSGGTRTLEKSGEYQIRSERIPRQLRKREFTCKYIGQLPSAGTP